MGEKRLNLLDRISEAQARISELFVHQCKFGEQTKRLPPELAACGQFVGDDATEINQLGLHGIAAALRVLGAAASGESQAILPNIIAYCEEAFGIGSGTPLAPELDIRAEDKNNVIKLGELLYGLAFVKLAQGAPERLIRYIGDRLTKAVVDGKGWGYFLDASRPELLPTAYATRGLAQHGYPVADARRFLLDGLGAGRGDSNSPADWTTAAACAYCLAFNIKVADSDKSVLKKTFLTIWSPLEPLMEEDIEQNVEYWLKEPSGTHYVRIPWQLYLLALSSEFSQWRFASFRAQHCLNRAVDAIRDNRFRYPYSSTYLSSRTNAIAYDVLEIIRNATQHLLWLRLLQFIDSLRVFFGSRPVRRAIGVLALGAIAYISYRWYQTGKFADLGPHFVAAFVVLLLSWGRR